MNQLELLGHSLVGGKTEIRLIKEGVVTSRFYEPMNVPDEKTLVDVGNNIYIGINPRKITSGKAEDISHLTCIVFDIDPVRAKGDIVSESRMLEACEIGEQLAKDFTESYVGSEAHVYSSGSGCHVYIPIKPIEIKDYKAFTESYRLWYKGIVDAYSTPEFKLDMIHDLPRVIRREGSVNQKNGRVCGHRISYGISNPGVRFDASDLFGVGHGSESSPTRKETVCSAGPLTSSLDSRFTNVVKYEPTLQACINKTATYPSRSESDYAFIGKLVEAGFDKDEVKILARKNPLGRGVEIKDSDVERIVEKFVNNGIKVKATTTYVDKYLASLKTRKLGMATGFENLDRMTGGQRPGEITIIAGRPSDGKSTLTTQIAYNMAINGKKVLIFPTELSAAVVYDKIMSLLTGVEPIKFRDGSFLPNDIKEIEASKSDLEALPLYIVEDFSLTAKELEKRVNQIKPDVVILDYIQAMAYPEGGSPKEISANIASIAKCAGESGIPFVVASQLSRPSEVSALSMNHLKGSGALEEKASNIIALVTLDKIMSPRPVDAHILKARYGETGKVEMSFDAAKCRFAEGR